MREWLGLWLLAIAFRLLEIDMIPLRDWRKNEEATTCT